MKDQFEKLALERGYGWLYRNIGADEHELLVGEKDWTEQQMQEGGYIFKDSSEDGLYEMALHTLINERWKP